jgi:hypothetical protein
MKVVVRIKCNVVILHVYKLGMGWDDILGAYERKLSFPITEKDSEASQDRRDYSDDLNIQSYLQPFCSYKACSI